MAEECTSAICREREKRCSERMEDTRKLFLHQVRAVDESIRTAKLELDRRLEGMNEFRGQLDKQARNFVDKGFYEVQHKNAMDKIEMIMTWKNNQEGRSSFSNIIAILALAVSMFTIILEYVLRR